MSACRVKWCVFDAAESGGACEFHLRRPLMHSWESAEEWKRRIRREDAAASRAVARAAISDQKLKARTA